MPQVVICTTIFIFFQKSMNVDPLDPRNRRL